MPSAKKPAAAPAPAVNLFAGAATIPAKTTAAKSKAEKKAIVLRDTERLCHYDAIMKAAEAGCKAIKAEMVEVVVEEFLGCGSESWPESMSAAEGLAQLGCQFKRRASNIALADGEVEILRSVGVEPHKEVTTQDLFAINPVYINDPAWQAKITKALTAIPGFPADMILRQQEVSKFVVTEAVATQVWKTGDAEAIGVCSSVSFVPKLSALDKDTLAKYVRELFDLPEGAEAAPTVKAVVDAAEARAREATKAATVKAAARAEGARKARASKQPATAK